MTTSDTGIALVKAFEGLFLDAYRDAVGIWTIGYGHTGLQHNDGTVHAGRVISKSQAEELLRYDLHQFEKRVNALITAPLSQNKFDALVSFDFNTGALHKSTLRKLLNAGDWFGAASEFTKWTKAGGRELRGLVRRRCAERDLFCSFPITRWLNG